jgi:glycosyltransferase involved in cell wall biosynthesis
MISDYTILTVILFVIFILAASVQLFYYLYFYLELYRHKPHPASETPAVSVIICARNEAENLEKFLPSVLEQKYPDYEVIVVNDCSEDNSYDILGTFLEKYPHLKISTITKDPKFTHNKRFAQFIGIKAAKNDVLLFTDADCYPVSERWIEGMASHFDDNTSFVLGYGGYLRGKGILGRYIAYDTMTIALQYLSMALKGIPYMGVGRNLAYRRSLFFENKGFGNHNHLISGDDDLFVNSHALAQAAHTRSVPSASAGEWMNQKKRHFTTAVYYKTRDKIILAAEPASRVIFHALFAVLLAFGFLWPVAAGIFVIRLITVATIFAFAGKRLSEPGMAGWSLLFDLVSPFINATLLTAGIIRKPGANRWK